MPGRQEEVCKGYDKTLKIIEKKFDLEEVVPIIRATSRGKRPAEQSATVGAILKGFSKRHQVKMFNIGVDKETQIIKIRALLNAMPLRQASSLTIS